MTRKERLQQIAESKSALTQAERRYIISTSKSMGLPFVERKCGDCYRDQAVLLWRKLVEAEQATDTERKYLLRPGIDVIFRGRRINATCSDEELKAYLAQGFSRNFFSRINGKDGRWL